ncbi:hypothetical protein [Sporisorium scitamineum]|uniref:Uncharacterized protein n=1 Tax=Sporisorium scitamineum TaxID=49012 RepID=A0A0F7SAM8_9BASI|nr:hypothetical protein [Sporisorium scitamineum]
MKLFALIATASIAIQTVFSAGAGTGYPHRGQPGNAHVSMQPVFQIISSATFEFPSFTLTISNGATTATPEFLQACLSSNRFIHRFLYLGHTNRGQQDM